MRNTESLTMQAVLRTYKKEPSDASPILVGVPRIINFDIIVPSSVKPTIDRETRLYRHEDEAMQELLALYNGSPYEGHIYEDLAYVQYHSGVSILIDGAFGVEGSSIEEYHFSFGSSTGKEYTQKLGDINRFDSAVSASEYRPELGRKHVNIFRIDVIQESYLNCTVWVVDSRGHASEKKTIKIPVLPYRAPYITNPAAVRSDEAGVTSSTGAYARATASWAHTPMMIKKRDSDGNIIISDTTNDDGDEMYLYIDINKDAPWKADDDPLPQTPVAHMKIEGGFVTENQDVNGNYIWEWVLVNKNNPVTTPDGNVIWPDGVYEADYKASYVIGGTRQFNGLRFSVVDGLGATNVEIRTITASDYVIYFKQGGTGIAFGQRVERNQDNIFAINEDWDMRHGQYAVPAVFFSSSEAVTPPTPLSSTEVVGTHLLWIVTPPKQTDAPLSWKECKIYAYC